MRLVFFLTIYFLIISIPSKTYSQTMSNDNYILQLHGIDATTSKTTTKDSALGASDQPAPKPQTEPKYKIELGFLHNKSKSPFTFSISETLIYFGTLSPTNPITRSNKLSVSSRSANGYSVIAFTNRELLASATSDVTPGASEVPSPSAEVIPDSSCDNGLCSEFSPAPWTNILTYGFGYRCDNVIGTDCAKGFLDLNFYKQFANNSKNEIPQKILSATNGKIDKIVQITYKVNISGTQALGSYNNTITYIAVPNF